MKRLMPGLVWEDNGDDNNITVPNRARKLKFFPQHKAIFYTTGGNGADFYYSLDSGRTFNILTKPMGVDTAVDVTEVQNVLAFMFMDYTTRTVSIWRLLSEIDPGDWFQVYEHTPGHMGYNIASNSRHVAFITRDSTGEIGDEGTTYELGISVDFSSFTMKDISLSTLSYDVDKPLIALSGGRIIVFQRDLAGASNNIIMSEDLGDTWETTFTDPEDADIIELLQPTDSGPLFAIRTLFEATHPNATLLRSTDGGKTWDEFLDPTIASGQETIPASLAYDQLLDVLYMQFHAEANNRIYAMRNASQVDVSIVNAAMIARANPRIATLGLPPYWFVTAPGSGLPNGYRCLISNKFARSVS